MSNREWPQEDFDRLAGLSAADFESLLDAEVSLVGEPGVLLSIVAVERRGHRDQTDRPGGEDRPFDVVLSAPADVDLQQGMHAVDLPGIGVVPLFLVRAGPTECGDRYLASFG